MNTMISMADLRTTTTVIAASGSPLAAGPYRTGGTVLAPTGLVLTGAVCPQATPFTLVASVQGAIWGNAGSGSVVRTEAGRPGSVRLFSDFSKPRHGSLASDGTG